jgi:basic amino acid/polyamine antiporter, APA family
MTTGEGAGQGGFIAAMTVTDATLLAIGSMIGSGIFIVSAGIARAVGSPAALLGAWVLTGVITILGALAVGEMASMYPRAGGQYVFLREAFGPFPAFLYGWTLLTVIHSGTIAAVAVAFGRFAGVVVPAIGPDPFAFLPRARFCAAVLGCHGGADAIIIGLTPQRLVAVGVVWLLTAANMRGVREGKTIQTSVTLVKAGAVIALVLLAFVVGQHDVAFPANFADGHFFAHPPTASPYLLVFGSAMVGCLFSTDAWANVTFAAAEVRNPGRNLPRALILGAAFVTVVYVCTNLAYLSVLPLSGVAGGATVAARGIQYATQDRVATAAAEQIFGAGGSVVMACAILLSTFGCANGLILGGARVYYAMACDGLMFARIGRLSERQVPAASLVLQAVWISVLCLSGTYTQLIQFVIFSVLVFYVVTATGLFTLRRSQPDVARPYRAWGYPVLPAIYIALTGAIALTLVIVPETRVQSLLGLLVVACGAPVYGIWKARKGRGERGKGKIESRE